MRDDAVGHGKLADRHLPFVSGRLQQHHASGCSAPAHIILGGANATAAAGPHFAPGALAGEIAAGGDLLGRYLLPIAFELLGNQLGKAGKRALTHLRACDAHDASIVGLDCDPYVDLGAVIGCAGRRAEAKWKMEPERKPAACSGGTDDELST